MCKRSRNRNSLPLPAGQLIRELVRMAFEANGGEERGTSLEFVRPAVQCQLQRDVLDRREERQKIVRLEHETELLASHTCSTPLGQPGDLASADDDTARTGRFQAADETDKRRLPAAARTGDCEAGGRLDVERDPLERADHA